MIVNLSGGVGGAKLAEGLQQVLGRDLRIIVNVADDFEHFGLKICPDIDTVTYTLSGESNVAQGWGVRNESWSFMDQVGKLGGDKWFLLGDRDIAMHVLRSKMLREGQRLTEITAQLSQALGVTSTILPVSDDEIATEVRTADGWLPFQEYFVRLRCEVAVNGFNFRGIETARPTAEVLSALDSAEAIIIGPSNPYVSVEPILAVPGLRDAIARAGLPVVAVSPIIGGQAVKGPAAKMMREFGLEPSALTVAEQYRGLVDLLVIDEADAALAPEIEKIGMKVIVAPTMMTDAETRRVLAETCLSAVRQAG